MRPGEGVRLALARARRKGRRVRRALLVEVDGASMQWPGAELYLAEDGEMYAFPWVEGGGGAAGALVRHPMNGPGKGGTMVYFSCEDAADEANRAVEAGGRIIQPKMAIGKYGHIALIQDSEGNVIGLHSMQ